MPPPSQSPAGVSLSSQVCVAPRTQPLAPQRARLARRARVISKPLIPALLKKSLTLLQISFGLRAEGGIYP
jgi:hypothetical protein